MESLSQVWDSILSYLRQTYNLSDIAYELWLSKVSAENIDFEGNVITLSVPNEFSIGVLKKSYSEMLGESIVAILGSPFEIKYQSEEEIKKEAAPAASSEDYEYTFETFIVGSSNKFAHAAAKAVSENPGKSYNPLFIYGNSGLGKTHLLYAISDVLKKKNPNINIAYVKGDAFTNELINSIGSSTQSVFHDKYRTADVLLVDDVQFIAGKVSTQEEFFHTFNSLYEDKKQIVLTSDRPPKEISTLEDRLKTRFEWGLIADIQPPDIDTRIAIVRRKAAILGIEMSNEVSEYIATKIQSNIRQLEGTVKKMQAQYQLTGIAPSIASAQMAITDIVNNDQPPPATIEKIIEEVSRTYNVSPDDLRSSKRQASIATARQIAIYIAREVTQQSLEFIGKEFNRNHSTVVHSINVVEDLISTDRNVRNTIDDIIKNIRNL